MDVNRGDFPIPPFFPHVAVLRGTRRWRRRRREKHIVQLYRSHVDVNKTVLLVGFLVLFFCDGAGSVLPFLLLLRHGHDRYRA